MNSRWIEVPWVLAAMYGMFMTVLAVRDTRRDYKIAKMNKPANIVLLATIHYRSAKTAFMCLLVFLLLGISAIFRPEPQAYNIRMFISASLFIALITIIVTFLSLNRRDRRRLLRSDEL